MLISTGFMISLSACGLGNNGGSTNIDSISGRESETTIGPPELESCVPQNYSGDTATISGNATYQRRDIFNDGDSGRGLGAPGSPRPIRFAEVTIMDENSNSIQCGSTDASGNFSLTVPISEKNLTFLVLSRALNTKLKASVLDAPERNKLYSLAYNFIPSQSSINIGNLNASATGTLFGAAFSMLDLIFEANEFLRTELGNYSSQISGCIDFTVANKVSIYWEKGFNPASYFNLPESGISFYLPGLEVSKRLFILGGINGDTDSSDTDHFDSAIILHEYGHFLEDEFSVSNSQGGGHTGQFPIDPRLAFSEAWGNFFQAAVLNSPSETNPMYIDTIGNIDGETNFQLAIPLESPDPSCFSVPILNGCDLPQVAGEGNYREFAITRSLWDAYDIVNDGESVTGAFNEIWASMTDGNTYTSSTNKFRSAGLFYQIQDNLLDASSSPKSDWSSLRGLASNLQHDDRQYYAKQISTASSCTERNFTITPSDADHNNYPNIVPFDRYISSNQFYHNDFYHYKHLSTGPLNLSLEYITPSGDEADLNLYFYNEDAVFGSDFDIMTSSTTLQSTSSSGNIETESVTLLNLAAGDYLINVKARTHNRTNFGDTTNYELNLGGIQLCP